MDTNEALLRAILATTARQVFPAEELVKLIAPTSSGEKQLLAYNLCDGTTHQAEIVKKANLDKGNLSRSISRWIEIGIIIRVGKEQCPLHVYPLPKEFVKTKPKKGK